MGSPHIQSLVVEGHVESECVGVVMEEQRCLLNWPLADHKVHDHLGLWGHERGGWREGCEVPGTWRGGTVGVKPLTKGEEPQGLHCYLPHSQAALPCYYFPRASRY